MVLERHKEGDDVAAFTVVVVRQLQRLSPFTPAASDARAQLVIPDNEKMCHCWLSGCDRSGGQGGVGGRSGPASGAEAA